MLKQYSGALQIIFHTNPVKKRDIEFTDFGQMVKKAGDEHYGYSSIVLRQWLQKNTDGTTNIRIRLRVNVEDNRLNYKVIQQLFNLPWQPQPIRPIGSNEHIQTSANEYGNAAMQYIGENKNIKKEIYFKFTPEGNLESITFSATK